MSYLYLTGFIRRMGSIARRYLAIDGRRQFPERRRDRDRVGRASSSRCRSAGRRSSSAAARRRMSSSVSGGVCRSPARITGRIRGSPGCRSFSSVITSCQSRVAKTARSRAANAARYRFRAGTTASPCGTARLPPGRVVLYVNDDQRVTDGQRAPGFLVGHAAIISHSPRAQN